MHDSHYSRQLKTIISRYYGRSPVKDSVLDCAISFFTSNGELEKQLTDIKHQQDALTQKLVAKSEKASVDQQKAQLADQLLDVQSQLHHKQKKSQQSLQYICEEVIEMSEGEVFEETNRKSAQFLGSIQLLSPTEGSQVAPNNEKSKGLYKGVLCLRLLDCLCINGLMKDPYISRFLPKGDIDYREYASLDPQGYKDYCLWVKMPILMAALLQDIGTYHPQARNILVGEQGDLPAERTLDIEQRKELLQITFKETINFITFGLGEAKYSGNSRDERDAFVEREKQKFNFLKQLIKNSIQPKNGIGNLLKVPQIYTSIILSTKSNYAYKVLPNVFNALNENSQRGNCNQIMVDCLYQVTGMFPQGYGVIYIPLESDGNPSDCYEYAIVNRLYPPNPEQPLCRAATRKLTYISFGQELEVAKSRNLFFNQSVKQMTKLSKERLNEILELLASNYKERQQLDLVPRCWHTKDYFSVKTNQKLWNRDDRKINFSNNEQPA